MKNKSIKVKVPDIKRVLKDIEKLNFDLGRFGRRATPDVVGFYGELSTWKELKSRFGWKGYHIDLGHGQTPADILMEKKGKNIKIEVKTSRLKKEWHGEGYGFALNIKKCSKHNNIIFKHPKKGEISGCFCYFDYLVGVLLSDDLKNKDFYIFPKSFIEKNEKSLRNKDLRFSSATHRIVFLGKQSDSKLITNFDRSFVKSKLKYKGKWSLIK